MFPAARQTRGKALCACQHSGPTEPGLSRWREAQESAIVCDLPARCVQGSTPIAIRHLIRQELKRVIKIVEDGYLQAFFLQAFDSELFIKELVSAHGVSLSRVESSHAGM